MQRCPPTIEALSSSGGRPSPALRIARDVLSPTRLDILWLLADGPMPVGSIAESLDLDSSSVSHALAVLRRGGLVESAVDRWKKNYRLTRNVHAEFTNARRVLTITSTDGGVELKLSEPDPRVHAC